MSTREQVHTAYSASMSAFAKRLALEPFKWHPDYAHLWREAMDAENAAEAEYERLAAEEETTDPVHPPDLRDDEQREMDAELWREQRARDGAWDAHWTCGGTRTSY